MERTQATITVRKDGRYMGKFIVGYGDNGKAQYQYVYGMTYSTTSYRDIAIPDALVEYFKMYRDEADFYILSGSDKPTEPRTMQYRYQKILMSAKVGKHHYHKLCHTFATNCAEHGFDMKTLSAVLGHSSVNLTLNRYVHPDISYQRRMLDNMCMQL